MEHTEQVPGETADRLQRLRELKEIIGSDVWEGDLSEMREDRPPISTTRQPEAPDVPH